MSSLVLSCLGALLTAVGVVSFWTIKNYVHGVSETIKALEQRMKETETTIAVTKAGFEHLSQQLAQQHQTIDANFVRVHERLDKLTS